MTDANAAVPPPRDLLRRRLDRVGLERCRVAHAGDGVRLADSRWTA